MFVLFLGSSSSRAPSVYYVHRRGELGSLTAHSTDCSSGLFGKHGRGGRFDVSTYCISKLFPVGVVSFPSCEVPSRGFVQQPLRLEAGVGIGLEEPRIFDPHSSWRNWCFLVVFPVRTSAQYKAHQGGLVSWHWSTMIEDYVNRRRPRVKHANLASRRN